MSMMMMMKFVPHRDLHLSIDSFPSKLYAYSIQRIIHVIAVGSDYEQECLNLSIVG